MKMRFVHWAGAALALSVQIVFATSPDVLQLKEKVAVPRGWSRLGAAPSEHTIKLQIGLYQSNFDSLERQLLEVSDPKHEKYGQHLSKEEVEALIAPHPAALSAVDSWLESHGIELSQAVARSPAQDWVTVSLPVRTVEQLLGTKYSVWRNQHGDTIVRTTEYSLPRDLSSHVEVIQPTTSFGTFKRMKTSTHFDNEESTLVNTQGPVIASTGASVDAHCNATVDPKCLNDLYHINYVGSASTKNSIATANYLEEYVNLTDLNNFYSTYIPGAVGSPLQIIKINGGLNNESDPGGEAALDSQYAFGLAYPAKYTYYSTGGRPPFKPDNGSTENSNEPYVEWQQYILSQPQSKIPLIVTSSYGDDEFTVPESYARRVCAGFAQLGARGVTAFVSSGDGGVGDGEPDPVLTECPNQFVGTFPAVCPYVTAVGGTRYISPEKVASFSGGGFSAYFSRPLYQTLAVWTAKSHLPKGVYAGKYNGEGRAYPDLSGQSVRFQVSIGGSYHNISGTSASSPAIAGIFAKLNDVRLKAKLPPLGFLNPLIYSGNGRGFFDITAGNNPGCGTPGFNATPGYDLATGLGTPNFPELKKLVLGLW